MKRIITAALVGALLAPAPAYAQTDAAQKKLWGPALMRVDASGKAYAQEIGLDEEWFTFCKITEAQKQDELPKNGIIPNGVDWNTIDAVTFPVALYNLEVYETKSIQLCLADVKLKLDGAKR